MPAIYDFSVEGLEGGQIDFSDFRGRYILIVNVASECGYTPQYAQLQELYQEFEDKLAIVGFPCNDFGGQEPGSPESIRSFCTRNFGVTFPLTAKVHVTGDNKHPVYQYLAKAAEKQQRDGTITWNFQKFLLDKNGELLDVLPPSASPFDENLLDVLAK